MTALRAYGFSSHSVASRVSRLDLPTRTETGALFQERIRREFIEGSAIAPVLFEAAVRVVGDTEPLLGGDVAYPIHEALNWRVTRFGYQARANQEAALLINEDGSCWQAKLSNPRLDEKGESQKYETPAGGGYRAYLPPIPPEIRKLIGDRYGVEVPASGSFWAWLEAHPEIPVIPTEGGKKALALLSLGYVAISLYGVDGGYISAKKTPDNTRRLIPDIERFATGDRPITLAFDQDEKETTKIRVAIALDIFGRLLAQVGCSVSVAAWQTAQGKGVDDLIVQGGAEAWDNAYTQSLPLNHWICLKRLEKRLTYPSSQKVNIADLSKLGLKGLPVPDKGIIGISSPKGTGKTKYIKSQVEETEKAVALGHRTALIRNLSIRLGIDYRTDLDKVNGEFIKGTAYTFRIGACVDSLLAIDPNKFRGCDLILDEVVQVVRHLLTSSTCARDGKRPALLARFHDLIRVARRVIAADADLDNQTLDYLKELRGEDDPIFLIRNDYQSEGYPVRFIQSPDCTVITGELLTDIQALPVGQTLFITTDSKGISKAISRLIAKAAPEKRVLLVNSETSGGECEREFIQTPDAVLERGEYDIVICSPSVATGVSIEVQGIIPKAYGIFAGVSSTDADMAQALGRVREPVNRTVWCAQRGSNFSRVSRSTNHLELKDNLRQKTSATIQLIRSSLKEDVAGETARYDWQSDPHLNLFSHIAAEQNFAMQNLRDALLVRLKFEGNQVTVENRDRNSAVKSLLAIARQEQREIDAIALVNAKDLPVSEILALEQKEGLTREEYLALAKFDLKEFYCQDTLTPEDVLADREGRRRRELSNLEQLLFPDTAITQSVRSLEKQAALNRGFCPWDFSEAALRNWLRGAAGLDEAIAKLRSGWKYDKYEAKPYAERVRELASRMSKKEQKAILGFTISERMSDTQIFGELLSQVGIKRKTTWSRSQPGHEGEKLRVHELDTDDWERTWSVLERRKQRRDVLNQLSQVAIEAGSPPSFSNSKQGGDPVVETFINPSKQSLTDAFGGVCQVLEPAEHTEQPKAKALPVEGLQKTTAIATITPNSNSLPDVGGDL